MNAIQLKGVRTHNLKNIDVTIPHQQIVVITGVSGSGKSSLAFDTLYAEGQRRYVESLSAYARQFLERVARPEVDSCFGLLPAIAIEAKNVISTARSTVGTQTEINDYLRVLFARVGKTFCKTCGQQVESDSPQKVGEEILGHSSSKRLGLVVFNVAVGGGVQKYLKQYAEELVKQGFIRVVDQGKIVDLTQEKCPSPKGGVLKVLVDRIEVSHESKSRIIEAVETAYRFGKGKVEVLLQDSGGQIVEVLRFSERFHCARCDIDYERLTPHAFSFNSPLGACPECQGFGRVITIDRQLVVPDENKSLAGGAIEPWTKPSTQWEFRQLLEYCKRARIPIDKPFRELKESEKRILFEGDSEDPDYFSVKDFFDYLEKKTYKMHVRIFLSKYRGYVRCPKCLGSRLKPEALQVKIQGRNIHDLAVISLKELAHFFKEWMSSPYEEEIAEPVLSEIRKRLEFLNEVGLGYLTLDRASRTLSGGEAQRINLATSLGASLVDTLYVLDEPSIGLHERDNQLLIGILKKLRDLGNTVVVVEHDRQMIETADEVIDLGPLAGERGGEIVFQGSVRELLHSRDSLTARYLSGKERIKSFERDGRLRFEHWIRILGAREHNLKNIDVAFPLGALSVITGVSGSGKSTLVYDTLYNNYLRFRGRPVQEVGAVRAVEGWEKIDDMVLIDQSPIGRTPRSNPVTYIGAFDEVRKIFASTQDAKREGITASDFSFNVSGGRCEECEGSGKIKVEMQFLADVYVDCERCEGKRFQDRILKVRYGGKNIDEVLNLTVGEAICFLAPHSLLVRHLEVLKKVGLGYLRLGQSATTLSAGEAQRMKLALELGEFHPNSVLYLFDEPTVGLHYHDIKYLMETIWELIQKGNSVLVIEHNMEVIRCADYIVDLGPEGGNEGGEVVFQGLLRDMVEKGASRSWTAQCLRRYLEKSASSV